MEEKQEETQEDQAQSPQTETVNTEAKRAHRSQKIGVVFSDKMQKTVVVRVDRLVLHTRYRRYVRRTSKFMAHDEKNECGEGDLVRNMETRPLSKSKNWRLVEIIERAK